MSATRFAAASSAAAVVMVIGALGIPAAASGGDVEVVNTETVQSYTDATGKVESSRVYEQLSLTGTGSVHLANPVATSGLRNLDGFTGFDVTKGNQIVDTDVDGVKQLRSVSDFKAKLPIKVSVAYRLNGKSVKPGDIVGKDGDLEVTYTVRNMTAAQQQVSVPDGHGGTVNKTVEVPVPLVGSLTTTAPSSFTDVASKQANLAGDGKGGTKLSFTMTLFPPIGSDTAKFGYTAKIRDGVVPSASVNALPVNPLDSPTFATAATSYKGGADTGSQLAAGATTIDGNLLKLRDGAGDLLAGLLQLRNGATQLDDGLSGEAAPGARKLADGSSKLHAGAGDAVSGSKDLSAGLGKISGGLGKLSASSGLPKAKAGATALKAGVDRLIAGMGTVGDAKSLIGGLAALEAGLGNAKTGAGQLHGGLLQLKGDGSQGNPGLVGAKGGVDQVKDGLGDAVNPGGSLDRLIGGLKLAKGTAGCSADPVCAGTLDVILPGVDDSKAKLTEARNGLGRISAGLGLAIDGLDSQLIPGAQKLADGVGAAKAGAGTLKSGAQQAKGGLKQVRGGLDQLTTGLADAVAGVLRLSSGAQTAHAGSGELTDGLGKIDAGTGQLSTGAGDLADGLGDAATGSGKLAEGLKKAAAGAPGLVDGAQQLSDKGTKKLVAKGGETAQDYGTLYATIAAGAKRADTEKMVFGAPDGAIGLTAYSFEIRGEDGEGSRNLQRGLAGLVVLALGFGALAGRRMLV